MLHRHLEIMKAAGHPGNAGFADATNVVCEKIQEAQKNSNTGFKQTQTARTYNITVTIEKLILHSTSGHPSQWNDKTLSFFDDYITQIKNGTILDDVEFELFERSKEGNVVVVKYQGVYLLVDNGYHRWVTMQAPLKFSSKRTQVRWSQWVESLRKAVECTFGIMKGRFRVLKSGVKLHGANISDKIWLTCCALHNMILLDGEDDISVWEGVMGDFEMDDVVAHLLPHPLSRLYNSPTFRDLRNLQHHDTSGMGAGEEEPDPNAETADSCMDENYLDEEFFNEEERRLLENPGEPRQVCKLSHAFFQSRLIENFNIRFNEFKDVTWPQAIKERKPINLN